MQKEQGILALLGEMGSYHFFLLRIVIIRGEAAGDFSVLVSVASFIEVAPAVGVFFLD